FPADFGAPAAAAVWDLKAGAEAGAAAAEDELTALLDRSLVQFDANIERYSLHDLMRPVARAAFDFVEGHLLQAGTTELLRAAAARFARYYLGVFHAAHRFERVGDA